MIRIAAAFTIFSVLLLISGSLDKVLGSLGGDSNSTNSTMTSKSVMSIPEMAALAKKCLGVVKDELKNRDLPVALLFIGKTENVLSSIAGNTTNSSLSAEENLCNWEDPESKMR